MELNFSLPKIKFPYPPPTMQALPDRSLIKFTPIILFNRMAVNPLSD